MKKNNAWPFFVFQIQGNITPHAIVILPKTDGMEMLVCYEDEGVYVNTYGRITKDVVLQWGEMPTSVGSYTPQMKRKSRNVKQPFDSTKKKKKVCE